MNNFFTPKEVAEMLKLNYRGVLDLITLGELSAYKIGRVYRISQGDFYQFLTKKKYKSPWRKR